MQVVSFVSSVNKILPTPKVATGGITGILTGFIIYELTQRFHITIAPEEAAFLTATLSFASSYFAPHSDPTPAQVAEIKQQQYAYPTTPL
jgi:hypothetical protein